MSAVRNLPLTRVKGTAGSVTFIRLTSPVRIIFVAISVPCSTMPGRLQQQVASTVKVCCICSKSAANVLPQVVTVGALGGNPAARSSGCQTNNLCITIVAIKRLRRLYWLSTCITLSSATIFPVPWNLSRQPSRNDPHRNIAVRSGRLLHRFPEDSGFDRHIQRAEREFLARSRSAQTALAENYVGLPLEPVSKVPVVNHLQKSRFRVRHLRFSLTGGKGSNCPKGVIERAHSGSG
jgi:hypothetical protein